MASREAPMKRCSFCWLDASDGVAQFPTRSPTSSCAHLTTVCTDCLRQYAERTIRMKGEVNVQCPDQTCEEILSHEDVRECVDSDTFTRYDDLVFRRMIQADESFRWCKRPGCGSGQLHDGGDDYPIVRCCACESRSCYTHDVPWHEELTCTQFTERLVENKNEEASSAYLARNTKTCPECGRNIQKNGGCDHMTCRPPGGCGHQFCWLCLAPYDNIARHGNHYHHDTCQHYRPESEDRPEREDLPQERAATPMGGLIAVVERA